ncbi:UDP-2,3-diacylglucosamine diphosphatase [Massilibacteroides sp.]|uniref:UDP-2,3-diacylglucosamine diphosphatase n=1 Tax=Massilibacteroides sp. TaxID=2034766 RepID=UPI002613FA98|nr:UDP-2,3-diacylglucosamine diphosphatase [Massilibacteroides sp.]MDD4515544.1 UDP-2,3-diacylglucosamine diphosphatase [Massilibacteroides sp.]
MDRKKYYPTVVVSDIHLGSEHSHTQEVTDFLNSIDCDKLILNGDIIDGWQLQKPGRKWKQEHTRFFKVLMKMMETRNTQIIYVRGNHDDFLDNLAPLTFSNISIVKDYMLEDNGKRYYVTHGDVFDTVTTNMRWLARLGDVGYTFLLWLNKHYNRMREKRGKSYFSLSQAIKHRVKNAVSYISDFEQALVKLARDKKADGVICGHIHRPANMHYGAIHYLNSGDWVESLTALVEDEQGEWSVVDYNNVNAFSSEDLLTRQSAYAAVI